MSLIVGSNSYVTVVEADDYLTDRIGTLDWFDLDDAPAQPGADSKESMLVTAYRWLVGSPTLDLPAVSSEESIKGAQIEAALYLLEHYTGMNERRAMQAQGVESFKFGKRTERFSAGTTEIPDHIIGMIDEYSTIGGVTFDLKGQYDV